MAKYKVVDVSKYQGVFNWDAAAAEIGGAIIKLSGGYDLIDPQFERNVSECERVGVPWGVYLYSYATTDEEARKEAATAVKYLEGKKPGFPVFLDCEDRTIVNQAARSCAIWYEAIKAAGYTPGVYGSASWFRGVLANVPAERRWVASWGTNNGQPQQNYKPANCDAWQYTSRGYVAGYSGRVDLSEFYFDPVTDEPVEPAEQFVEHGSSGEFTADQPSKAYTWTAYHDGTLVAYVRDWFAAAAGSSRTGTLNTPHGMDAAARAFIEPPSVIMDSDQVELTLTAVTPEEVTFTAKRAEGVPRFVVEAVMTGRWK